MRAIVQRVKKASVEVDGELTASIRVGLLVLVGICDEDGEQDVEWMARKVCNMRIFPSEGKNMDCSLLDVGGEAIVVSQFTLFASTKKGNRPSFLEAGEPNHAEAMVAKFRIALADGLGRPVGAGVFGADMTVSIENDGPVTITLDSQARQ